MAGWFGRVVRAMHPTAADVSFHPKCANTPLNQWHGKARCGSEKTPGQTAPLRQIIGACGVVGVEIQAAETKGLTACSSTTAPERGVGVVVWRASSGNPLGGQSAELRRFRFLF